MESGSLYSLRFEDDQLEAELREVDGAIAMVARGIATRIRLVGMADADRVAPIALALAQRAGVAFRVDHGDATSLTFGPAR